jgi:signal transduction histidine kinase
VTGLRGHVAFVSVSNPGPVVDAGDIDQLTRPFERLATERTGHRDGSGLGLSIVQAIVNAHAGFLTLRPRPGGGLTVEAAFPGAASADENSKPGSPSPVKRWARQRPDPLTRNVEHW